MPLTPGLNQPHHDLVFTPLELAAEIVNHFPLEGRVLDPAKGTGAFYNQFPPSVESLFCEIKEGSNFYFWKEPVDWIITNPPWSHMRSWLKHCFKLSPNIVLLVTFTHLCTKARLRDMRAAGFGFKEFYCVPTPPPPWPSSGFQLGAAHLVKGYEGPLHLTGAVGR